MVKIVLTIAFSMIKVLRRVVRSANFLLTHTVVRMFVALCDGVCVQVLHMDLHMYSVVFRMSGVCVYMYVVHGHYKYIVFIPSFVFKNVRDWLIYVHHHVSKISQQCN